MDQESIKTIIRKLLGAEDYRIEVVSLIDYEFLNFVIDFFKKITEAKFKNESITPDWYKEEFLNSNLPADEIAIHAGLNKKTIHNMYNSATKEIVINASNQHYDSLYDIVERLVDNDNEIDIKLTIKFNSVSVDLNVSESLIIINTLAVKRASLRGGMWSFAGKRVRDAKGLCRHNA